VAVDGRRRAILLHSTSMGAVLWPASGGLGWKNPSRRKKTPFPAAGLAPPGSGSSGERFRGGETKPDLSDPLPDERKTGSSPAYQRVVPAKRLPPERIGVDQAPWETDSVNGLDAERPSCTIRTRADYQNGRTRSAGSREEQKRVARKRSQRPGVPRQDANRNTEPTRPSACTTVPKVPKLATVYIFSVDQFGD
jgi:hypothetical protein